MNHQPFEEWLLNEINLIPDQKRELDLHLRSCAHCAAISETGKVLNSAKMVLPPAGFTVRFQARLAERKLAERRRKIIGTILFTMGGLGFLLWLASPSLLRFLSSPEVWIATLVELGIFFMTTLQALSQAGSVLLRVIPDFVPPFAWIVLVSAFAGISLLWSVSIWRFVRVPRGV
jgi:hypothetical protein